MPCPERARSRRRSPFARLRRCAATLAGTAILTTAMAGLAPAFALPIVAPATPEEDEPEGAPPAFAPCHASLRDALDATAPDLCRDAAGRLARADDPRAFRTLLGYALDTSKRLAALDAAHASLLDRLETLRARQSSRHRAGRGRLEDLIGDRSDVERIEGDLAATRREWSDRRRILDAIARAAADVVARSDGPRRDAALALLDRRAVRSRAPHAPLAAIAIVEGLPAELAAPRLVGLTDPRVPAPVRVRAIRALGREGVAPGVLAARAADAVWPLRAAAYDALTAIGTAEARAALVDARGRESEGRLAADLDARLAAWPEGSDGDRNEPDGRASATGESNDDAARAIESSGDSGRRRYAFYGIRSPSRRVVFVLDVSGSMEERASASDRRKIDRALEELGRALDALPDDAEFDVVLFGDGVREFADGLARADAATRERALEFAARAEVRGGTNLFDALRHAFGVHGLAPDPSNESLPDTVFVLSDGEPNRGEIVDPEAILDEIERWNELCRVRIHAIGIGSEIDAPLLRTLARSSGGRYVHRP